MPTKPEKATYPLKIQAIRSKGQNLRFYVYLPMPLAGALGIAGGEEVEWELLNRQELRLVRRNPAVPKAQRRFTAPRRS
jgi:hypothetical protein